MQKLKKLDSRFKSWNQVKVVKDQKVFFTQLTKLDFVLNTKKERKLDMGLFNNLKQGKYKNLK